MIQHIVMWKIKASEHQSKEQNIQQVAAMLRALPQHISEIVSFEVGVNYCTEPTAFDVVLNSSFHTEEAMERYKVHEEHVKVAVFIKSVVAERAVVDYIV